MRNKVITELSILNEFNFVLPFCNSNKGAYCVAKGSYNDIKKLIDRLRKNYKIYNDMIICNGIIDDDKSFIAIGSKNIADGNAIINILPKDRYELYFNNPEDMIYEQYELNSDTHLYEKPIMVFDKRRKE